MKKKIVYISGADVFDVNDVRAAFEEVRQTLKLTADTILFGVPVDESECMANTADLSQDSVQPSVITETESIEASNNTMPDENESVVDLTQDDFTPVKSSPAPDAADDSDSPVVPILSVLATKTQVEPNLDDASDTEPNSDADILDGLEDEVPTTSEKTLEELFETTAPLCEDVEVSSPRKNKKENNAQTIESEEIDATLENLASEFAENQDKVVSTKKGSERGKIGKLKNILPFKKIRRDDSGLMGDLFGWAGIAANDEDFTMPDFFKQKKM